MQSQRLKRRSPRQLHPTKKLKLMRPRDLKLQGSPLRRSLQLLPPRSEQPTEERKQEKMSPRSRLKESRLPKASPRDNKMSSKTVLRRPPPPTNPKRIRQLAKSDYESDEI
jgi:hypothetical protein